MLCAIEIYGKVLGGDELIRHTAKIDRLLQDIRQSSGSVASYTSDSDSDVSYTNSESDATSNTDSVGVNPWVMMYCWYSSLVFRALRRCPSLDQLLRIIELYHDEFPEGLRDWELGMIWYPPLCEATLRGHIEVIDALLDRGCSLELVVSWRYAFEEVERNDTPYGSVGSCWRFGP